MNRKDFLDWKEHPMTRAMFDQLLHRIDGLKTELSFQAGDNVRLDSIKVGAIQAFRDVLDADWFEETDK